MKIYPAILEETKRGVEEKVKLVRGLVERVQLDVVDGLFADNLTVTPEDLREINWGELGVDVHLMVDDPMEWVEACLSLPKARLIAQVERLGSQSIFVDWVKGYREIKGVGLALKLETPIEALKEEILKEVEVIVLLAVKAGFQGQGFEKRVIEKIKRLKKMFEGEVVVDGGVNQETIERLVEAGVDGVAVGSYLWQDKQVEQRINYLKKVGSSG